MAGRGGVIPGQGRKPKADEMRIRDLVSPYVDGAIETVAKIMVNGERDADKLAAAKLLLAYMFGNPKDTMDHNGALEIVRKIIK